MKKLRSLSEHLGSDTMPTSRLKSEVMRPLSSWFFTVRSFVPANQTAPTQYSLQPKARDRTPADLILLILLFLLSVPSFWASCTARVSSTVRRLVMQ
jgi:hypothetical protein